MSFRLENSITCKICTYHHIFLYYPENIHVKSERIFPALIFSIQENAIERDFAKSPLQIDEKLSKEVYPTEDIIRYRHTDTA